MEIVFGLFILACFAYGAYHLWYVPHGTSKKGKDSGSKPDERVSPDKH